MVRVGLGYVQQRSPALLSGDRATIHERVRGDPADPVGSRVVNKEFVTGLRDSQSEQAAFATSGVDGLITGTLETRVSEGCGLERCSNVTLVDPVGDCAGTQSTLLVLNQTTVSLSCGTATDE